MMMTTTDDYHHCGPRVRYLAATTIIYLDFGAVLDALSLSLFLSLYFLSFHYMKHNEAAPGKSNYLYEPTFSLRVICQQRGRAIVIITEFIGIRRFLCYA